jgi:hypothetical protein
MSHLLQIRLANPKIGISSLPLEVRETTPLLSPKTIRHRNSRNKNNLFSKTRTDRQVSFSCVAAVRTKSFHHTTHLKQVINWTRAIGFGMVRYFAFNPSSSRLIIFIFPLIPYPVRAQSSVRFIK